MPLLENRLGYITNINYQDYIFTFYYTLFYVYYEILVYLSFFFFLNRYCTERKFMVNNKGGKICLALKGLNDFFLISFDKGANGLGA